MNVKEQFRIDSLEELKEAYEYFKSEWDKDYLLESEIRNFIRFGYRFIVCNSSGITLFQKCSYYKEIPNPLKQMKSFTISGSPELKKAFCEEAGLSIHPDSLGLGFIGLCHAWSDVIWFSYGVEGENHFHLPDNYQEALEFVKMNEKHTKTQEETYSIGDMFTNTTTNETYILSEAGENRVHLTCLEGGEIYSYCVEVDNIHKVSSNEMRRVAAGNFNDFEKVKPEIIK